MRGLVCILDCIYHLGLYPQGYPANAGSTPNTNRNNETKCQLQENPEVGIALSYIQQKISVHKSVNKKTQKQI